MEFKRFENETDEELIYRVCSQKKRLELGTMSKIF